MIQNRVKISSILNNQFPEYVQSEFPLVIEFIKQYYNSLESTGNPVDIIHNIDQYVKVDNITNLTHSTQLTQDTTTYDRTISVVSTAGFSDYFGLIRIGQEILTYEYKTDTTFENCYRGFSGVTSYNINQSIDALVFEESSAEKHLSGDEVENLNILLLTSFFKKLKTQVSPGFEDKDFFENLNESLFIKQSNNFYTSKGTTESFSILFKALYGKTVKTILPRDFLIEPSDAQYRVVRQLVVEVISGDIEKIINRTIFQNESKISTFAEGVINQVERIVVNNETISKFFSIDVSKKSSQSRIKEYYLISLDYEYNRDSETIGTTKGQFTIHPKTKIVSDVFTGQSHLDVDSTIGFPASGSLIIDLPDGSITTIQYQSKTINQFFECTGINQDILAGEEVKYDDYAFSFDENGNEIRLRVTGVIADTQTPQDINLLEKGDKITSKTLGKYEEDFRLNNWFFNIKTKYDVETITLIDNQNFVYEIETIDENDFKLSDSIFLLNSNGTKTNNGIIESIEGKKKFSVSGFGNISLSSQYKAYRNISKVRFQNYSDLNFYNANVSNVYYESDSTFYVTSPSLPNYNNELLKIYDGKISGQVSSSDIVEFNGSHLFLTGDQIILRIDDLNETQVIGYAKKESNNTIKIAITKESIETNNFIDLTDYLNTSVTAEYFNFNTINVETQKYESNVIEPQKLVRKVTSPIDPLGNKVATRNGPVGVFLNGVEIYNYRSNDFYYYGSIESIEVLSGGSDYDVKNPPLVSITDTVGTGCSATCFLTGHFERIEIVNPGFNYLKTPNIVIKGGNGTGASANVSLVSYDHFSSVNVTSTSVDSVSDTITFSSPHKFSDFEEIIYLPENKTNISGLSTDSKYFVKTVGINTIKLYSSLNNAIADTEIQISSTGASGQHKFQSVKKKRRLGSISINNPGSNYQNKEYTVSSSGISTFSNTINIDKHQYNTGEIITYTAVGDEIGGLTNGSDYYVKKVDENSFRLYEISSGKNADFLLKTDQYVNLTSIGSTHIFNYPEIEVLIEGEFEIPTGNSEEGFKAEVQPIVKGSIDSILVTEGGINYGSSSIINFPRQPVIELKTGNDAEISVVVVDGKIVSAFVVSSGENYTAPPNLTVVGTGVGAVLTPIVENGQLINVIIVAPGGGYSKFGTTVTITPPGFGGEFSASIKQWFINLVPKLISGFDFDQTFDDGYIVRSKFGLGLQYSHLYGSRSLRQNLTSERSDEGQITYTPDLILENGVEVDSISHSPIVGWSYDGHPIYGPYGYSNTDGSGGIKQMVSGYTLNVSPNNRPSKPNGFFVNDYIFTNAGDLDESNGRFCVTPEYPNGIYAYFLTFETEADISGFSGYKRPQFPYVIGEVYKSLPIQFNYNLLSNDEDIDFNSTNWLRNTKPYQILNKNSGYDYFLNSEKIQIQSQVSSVSRGTIDSTTIIEGGTNYQVGDKLILDNSNSGGDFGSVVVSKIEGSQISNISCASTYIPNVEFLNVSKNNYIAYFDVEHNLNLNDDVIISIDDEDLQFTNISFNQNIYKLSVGLSTITSTGFCTYIGVSGNFSSNIVRVNDLYQIKNEIVKILEIDKESSRIRILRDLQENPIGIVSHTAGTSLTELSKKGFVNLNIENNYENRINKEIYFNPSESFGLGSLSGPGITSTLVFSDPGVGATILTIPTKTIYLKNHNLNTGDSLTYDTNGSTEITVDDGNGNFSLPNLSDVYVLKVTNDLIGISTTPIGIGSTGVAIGIGSVSADTLYFIGVGDTTHQSFRTQYDDNLTGDLTRNLVTVSTVSEHNLSILDKVDVDLSLDNLSKTVIVKYNEYNRRFIIDPLSINSVNISKNILEIENHNFLLGDKIIYEYDTELQTEIGGLTNNSIYYVIPTNANEFKLASTKYNAENNISIDLTSSGDGEILRINYRVNNIKFKRLIFDLSDESLSYQGGGTTRFPSFEFNIYSDQLFSDNLYEKNDDIISIQKNGIIGVDANANVTLVTNKNSPNKLFYNLVAILSSENPEIKKEIIYDDEQNNYNQINIIGSTYNGRHSIVNLSDTAFNYTLNEFPESSQYFSSDGLLEYTTDSKNTQGKISELKILNKGNSYQRLPKIDSIKTDDGSFAILFLNSSTIGKVNNTQLTDIGYNYSSDLTISPTAQLPITLNISQYFTFGKIEVLYPGFSYNSDVRLITIDGLTDQFISDNILQYNVADSKVEIIQNTEGISNYQPTLVPINNPNGIGIVSFGYNSDDEILTAYLSVGFSDEEDFPFFVGEKVLIEGVIVEEDDAKGYNSKNYGYKLFEIVGVNTALGGFGAFVSYDFEGLLEAEEFLGTVDIFSSDSKIVPQRYFPTFDIELIPNEFTIGEVLSSEDASGIVQSWSSDLGIMKVSSSDTFEIETQITGSYSGSKGIINTILSSDGSYKIDSSSIVNLGWRNEKGFLNNPTQKIHDSDYYQYFSYSLKSEIEFDTWNDPVSSLNHTAGFKKFSDLDVISVASNSGLQTSQNNSGFDALAVISSVVDVECDYNFDLASENILTISDEEVSNRIFFNSSRIFDYIESIGNRVLTIDDISSQFKSSFREEPYSTVSSFSIEKYQFVKYFITLSDSTFRERSMFDIVNVIHDNQQTYLNQYGRLYSEEPLGSYDVGINSERFELQFYPTDFLENSYNLINVSSLNLGSILSGISTIELGDSASIQSYSTIIPANTQSTTGIATISANYRAVKVLSLISRSDGLEHQYSELNVVNDGNNVYHSEFATLQTSDNNRFDQSSVGIITGILRADLNGDDLEIGFEPVDVDGNPTQTEISYIANSIIIGIGSTGTTGVGTFIIGSNNSTIFESEITNISANPSPSPVSISTYSASEIVSSYAVISVEDLTNEENQISELVLHSNELNNILNQSEFGLVSSGSSVIGIITSYVSGIGENRVVDLYFTPEANVEYSIRTFKIVFKETYDSSVYSVNDYFDIYGLFNFYLAAELDTKVSFNLQHKENDIFVRTFDSSSSGIGVSIADDSFNIKNHFFVTGEEIIYDTGEDLLNVPIGIAATTIPGIGLTDILPSTLYAVKLNDLKIRVSGSASEALLPSPKYLELDSFGEGTHLFKSQKQDTKCIIAIDNVIQSPLVSLAKTTLLVNDVDIFDSVITLENPNELKSNEYLNINNEKVKILVVGYASSINDVLIQRGSYGSQRENHSSGSLVQLIDGQYTITDNTINFIEPPLAEVPQENFNNPDEVDYSGIKISSTFNGRVFLRSGFESTEITPYQENYIFDSLSDQFSGVNNIFDLKSEGEDVVGISTNNIINLIRSIFQMPSRGGNKVVIPGTYDIEENSGITSITFTGTTDIASYDINISGVPLGGVIVSVGSTEGFGYQPLVSAGGTALVSAAGTIQSISIGNSGSGYRSGIQTTVNVGVQTEDVFDTNIEFIGTAAVSGGHVVSIEITNPGSGYTSYPTLFTTLLTEPVGSGDTLFYVQDMFDIVDSNFVSVGTGLTNVAIVGVGTTSFTIDNADTVTQTFSVGEQVIFKEFRPPLVVFDAPLSYSDIPLIYSNDSQSGIGTEATISIVVSQDSSVLNFELKNFGYGYRIDDILTFDIGGTTGIPTDTSLQFEEFQLRVTDVYYDASSAWHLGGLQVFDPFDDLINGSRTLFPLRIDNVQTSIEKRKGSVIDLKSTLLIFINDVLQIPGVAYKFEGGSLVNFTEPIAVGSKTNVLFYSGTLGVDTRFVDIFQTIKIGDTVQLISDEPSLNQNKRFVQEIISSDTLRTNIYNGIGLSNDETLLRNVIWCKQRNDIFLTDFGLTEQSNNFIRSKARESYLPYIHPTSYLIKDFGTEDQIMFVDNVRTTFDSFSEYQEQPDDFKRITVMSQDSSVTCTATAVVNASGNIDSITILNSGSGYDFTPEVYISNPIGAGVTAILTATLSGESISNIGVTLSGSGYDQNNPPSVLVESPKPIYESITGISYEGDFGVITGININAGVNNEIIFDFHIPLNSYLRDDTLVGTAVTLSDIQTGYYFVITDSNIGDGLTSEDENNVTVGVGTTFIDNVYKVINVGTGTSEIPGIGVTYVTQVTVYVDDFNGIVSSGSTYCYGNYSWGRITNLKRKSPKEFTIYNNGITGIQTSPIVQRYYPYRDDY